MGRLDTAEHEEIRMEILELCRDAAPYGAGTKALRSALRKGGYDLTDRELLTQVDYLKGKGLVRTQEVENRRLELHRLIVHLTPDGMDFLEGNGPDVTGVG
ncbi:MAG: hypothetical protein OSJ72_17460 [Lachnospiraceae bacterium]|nr:hypothetical protein [Lachnospiraceae bacterium]